MSETSPEGGGGGGFLGARIFGIPVWVILVGVVVLGFFMFRSRSGSQSQTPATDTSGSGSDTTGNITIDPGTTTIDVPSGGSSGSGDVTNNPPASPAPKPTPNPQPAPKPPNKPPVHVTPVRVPPKPAAPVTVTVAKWTAKNTPWNSTLSGIAAHEHTTVAALMKLNPQIKNANVIQAGSKVRIR